MHNKFVCILIQVFGPVLILILDSRHAGDSQKPDDRLRLSFQPQSITALWPVPDIYYFIIEAHGCERRHQSRYVEWS